MSRHLRSDGSVKANHCCCQSGSPSQQSKVATSAARPAHDAHFCQNSLNIGRAHADRRRLPAAVSVRSAPEFCERSRHNHCSQGMRALLSRKQSPRRLCVTQVQLSLRKLIVLSLSRKINAFNLTRLLFETLVFEYMLPKIYAIDYIRTIPQTAPMHFKG